MAIKYYRKEKTIRTVETDEAGNIVSQKDETFQSINKAKRASLAYGLGKVENVERLPSAE